MTTKELEAEVAASRIALRLSNLHLAAQLELKSLRAEIARLKSASPSLRPLAPIPFRANDCSPRLFGTCPR